jgi:hypothetical protein
VTMRHLRRPSVPGFVLGLFLGLGLLVPEVGHSLAHYHAADHHTEPTLALGQHGAAGIELTDAHHGGDHPHLELVATPSSKPSLIHALVMRSVALALHVPGEEQPLPPAVITGRPPGDREHGPPPPSRAPPLV